jgi:hypothetical protein
MASFVGLKELKGLFEAKQPRKLDLGATLAQGNIAVGTAAVQVAAANDARRRITIVNEEAGGGNDIYLGSSDGVTTANGFHLAPGIGIEIFSQAAIYAIASGATSDLRYIEEAD